MPEIKSEGRILYRVRGEENEIEVYARNKEKNTTTVRVTIPEAQDRIPKDDFKELIERTIKRCSKYTDWDIDKEEQYITYYTSIDDLKVTFPYFVEKRKVKHNEEASDTEEVEDGEVVVKRMCAEMGTVYYNGRAIINTTDMRLRETINKILSGEEDTKALF